jgi:hypothetical protein
VDFSLQDIGSGGGWSGVSESFGGNGDTGSGSIWSSLETGLVNVGVNAAAGAASIGLGSLGKSAGVSTAYPSYNPLNLTRPPGSVPNYGASFGAGGSNVVVIGGVLLVGLLLVVALRGRG